MKIPKIGKRGWLGVILLVLGVATFVGANSQAKTEADQNAYQDGVNVSGYQDAVAHDAGYNSFEDYLAQQNRGSGKFFVCVGVGLIWWGFKRYNGKKPESGKPTG